MSKILHASWWRIVLSICAFHVFLNLPVHQILGCCIFCVGQFVSENIFPFSSLLSSLSYTHTEKLHQTSKRNTMSIFAYHNIETLYTVIVCTLLTKTPNTNTQIYIFDFFQICFPTFCSSQHQAYNWEIQTATINMRSTHNDIQLFNISDAAPTV